jgi:hypothetical protein
MRRLIRWAFNFTAALSAVLCGATAGLWARSHFVTYRITRNYPTGFQECATLKNEIAFGGASVQGWPTQDWTVEQQRPPEELNEKDLAVFSTHFYYAGFAFIRGTVGMNWDLAFVVVPFWFLLTCLLLLPAIRLAAIIHARRVQRRSSEKLCATCGYDLHASPDRCPECGSVPDAKAAQ